VKARSKLSGPWNLMDFQDPGSIRVNLHPIQQHK
jgi:hypothetical protein